MNFKDLLLILEDNEDIPGDTEGIEPGETGMPKGQGYPNAKKDIDKVVWLGVIHGVTDQEEKAFNDKYVKGLKEFIKTHVPWLIKYEQYSYDYLTTMGEISNFVYNAGSRFRYWANSDLDLDLFGDNPSVNVQRKQKVNDILKQYPDALAQLDKLDQYIKYAMEDSPDDPTNKSNYPLHVSLYDRTRELGGHEEGGWWYDVYKLLDSKVVNDFRQAENTAKYLYNRIPGYGLDGQPVILLEKVKGGEDTTNKSKPIYQ